MLSEFIFFILPIFIAAFNARITQAGHSSTGLHSFYKAFAVLGLLNWLYFLYAIFVYYPTCGGGRHACSSWRDATVNAPSQLRFVDLILSTFLAIIYFLREDQLGRNSNLNAWQCAPLSILLHWIGKLS